MPKIPAFGTATSIACTARQLTLDFRNTQDGADFFKLVDESLTLHKPFDKIVSVKNVIDVFLKITRIIVLINVLPSCKNQITDEEAIESVKNTPKRLLDTASRQKLKKYEIYFSLTTSPERIPHLQQVLSTLDFDLATAVFISLPKYYRNDPQNVYSDSFLAELRNYSNKIEILREEEDLGPVMKLIPAVKEARQRPGSWFEKVVMTLDDDTVYPMGLPQELVYQTIQGSGAFGGSGRDASDFGVREFPRLVEESRCDSKDISACDILEGFHGVVYRVSDIEVDQLERIAKKSKDCRFSDDLMISYVLAKAQVKRTQVNNRYTRGFQQLSYGFEENALHRMGQDGVPTNNHEHASRYRKCADFLKNYFLDQPQSALP
ncbi:MAG: hypothetical protein I8H75_00420 [Myxococcaceae bacterium]|nr:hypothetical protein [Myxococcaceae bacterium]MBH2005809.1 hypothetical protein [Myxococcaceae bacterium]